MGYMNAELCCYYHPNSPVYSISKEILPLCENCDREDQRLHFTTDLLYTGKVMEAANRLLRTIPSASMSKNLISLYGNNTFGMPFFIELRKAKKRKGQGITWDSTCFACLKKFGVNEKFPFQLQCKSAHHVKCHECYTQSGTMCIFDKATTSDVDYETLKMVELPNCVQCGGLYSAYTNKVPFKLECAHTVCSTCKTSEMTCKQCGYLSRTIKPYKSLTRKIESIDQLCTAHSGPITRFSSSTNQFKCESCENANSALILRKIPDIIARHILLWFNYLAEVVVSSNISLPNQLKEKISLMNLYSLKDQVFYLKILEGLIAGSIELPQAFLTIKRFRTIIPFSSCSTKL